MNILNKGWGIGVPTMKNAQNLPPQIVQNIQQLKQMRAMFNGDMSALIGKVGQQSPQMQQVMQMAQNGNPEQIVRTMCAQQGIDFDAFISAIK